MADIADVVSVFKTELAKGIPSDPSQLPTHPIIDANIPHAPIHKHNLSKEEYKLALKNSLRYFPKSLHSVLLPEFEVELKTYGHIYMYRFRPTKYTIKAYPISYYPAKTAVGSALILMIMNNLSYEIAQFPWELVTYGTNGSVLSNWAQYLLLIKYLCELESGETLNMYSGHPLGIFPNCANSLSPSLVITNGLVVPNYSTKKDYEKLYALGVSIYGQMTAGSYCYIGPQGIVHGTTLTIMNAGRKYLREKKGSLAGVVYLSSGLGGMSGAQSKSGVICGAISVIAEVDPNAYQKRYNQGWVMKIVHTLDDCINLIKTAKIEKKPLSIAFAGNIVDLWERLAEEKENLVELGSDQTSCHNVYGGGYIPVGLTLEQARTMLVEEPEKYADHVKKSLCRQIIAINKLAARGLKFWDYGNSFLLEASRAKADVFAPDGIRFKYPSYIQDLLSDMFGLGFGPFRWVCCSCDPSDLQQTDLIAANCIKEILAHKDLSDEVKAQYNDNLKWIESAGENKLVVGSQARILYADAEGRIFLATSFNKAVKNKVLKGPVVISRDHHDVSGTDSPYRETSNVYDGSSICADMAVHNFVGDSFRGAHWVALHNGGGTGWGEATNGGFGIVLDGSEESEVRATTMLKWDVINGISRRAWSGNKASQRAIQRIMQKDKSVKVTFPNDCDESLDNI